MTSGTNCSFKWPRCFTRLSKLICSWMGPWGNGTPKACRTSFLANCVSLSWRRRSRQPLPGGLCTICVSSCCCSFSRDPCWLSRSSSSSRFSSSRFSHSRFSHPPPITLPPISQPPFILPPIILLTILRLIMLLGPIMPATSVRHGRMTRLRLETIRATCKYLSCGHNKHNQYLRRWCDWRDQNAESNRRLCDEGGTNTANKHITCTSEQTLWACVLENGTWQVVTKRNINLLIWTAHEKW